MPKLRVHNFSISLDGYAAGPSQGPDHPLGVGGERLFDNLEGRPTGYECVELVSSPAAAHVQLVRTAANGSG